jgi:hypothetical protein
MRSRTSLFTLCVLAAACADRGRTVAAPDFSIPIVADRAMSADDMGSGHYNPKLVGTNETPSRDTPAHGRAVFHVSDDGMSVDYQLVVNEITNVRQSHIHIGQPGTNGPIVVFLYGPVAAGGGPIDGMIARGTFTAANMIGPLAGHQFSELLDAMRTGNAYVNVHTDDGIAPANTGPGDFPGGEIRGVLIDKKLE